MYSRAVLIFQGDDVDERLVKFHSIPDVEQLITHISLGEHLVFAKNVETWRKGGSQVVEVDGDVLNEITAKLLSSRNMSFMNEENSSRDSICDEKNVSNEIATQENSFQIGTPAGTITIRARKGEPDTNTFAPASSSSTNNSVRSLQNEQGLMNNVTYREWYPTNCCSCETRSIKSAESLKYILDSSVAGTCIFAYYENHNSLDDRTARKVAYSIVSLEMKESEKKDISPARFKELANHVIELFPTEKIVDWYMPSRKTGQKRYITPRGRLVYAFHAIRKELIKNGLIIGRRSKEKTTELSEQSE